MINLKSSKQYKKFKKIKNILFFVLIIPSLVALLGVFILSTFINKEKLQLTSNIVFCICSFSLLLLGVLLIINQIFQKKLRHEGIKFFFDLIKKTKIVGNPKVVYVYTTHNDLMEARVLQNSQQSYKNIEIWISDGSDDDKLSEKYKVFAMKHGFKYFKVGSKGSQNKAENLNAFLSKSGATFDYLLISDGDEYINSNFVEHALKCFIANIKPNLGYICPLNYCYEGDNLYNNVILNVENTQLYKNDYNKIVNNFYFCNLYSSSCLISNKFLQSNGGKFPDGCLEDVFLECIATVNGYEGLILPTSPCGQQFDKGPNQYSKRVGRIHSWVIKLLKKFPYKKQGKTKNWYAMENMAWNISILLGVIAVPVVPLLLVLLLLNAKVWIASINFVILISSIVLLIILAIVSISIDKPKYNSYGKYVWFMKTFHLFSMACSSIKQWWKSYVKNKYSEFVTSSKLNNQQISLTKNWILLISSLILLIVYVCLHTFYIGYSFAKIWTIILFIYVVFTLLLISFISFGNLILNFASKKIVSNYDTMKFILLPNWYKFEQDKTN